MTLPTEFLVYIAEVLERLGIPYHVGGSVASSAHGMYRASADIDVVIDPSAEQLEALGRALFHAQRYSEAAAEFEAVVERAPTNDFALFCWGRSLQLLGRHKEARHPLALAAQLRPERRDYRQYRDQARRRAA